MNRFRTQTWTLVVVILGAMSVTTAVGQGAAQTARNEEFVQRSGTKLTLGGADFRYSGPNIEWLELKLMVPTILWDLDTLHTLRWMTSSIPPR